MEKITYIFYQGRKENIENKKFQALDHYYLINNFISDGYPVEIIELDQKASKINKLLYYYDRFLNKFLSLPSYTHKVCNFANYRILKKSDRVFIVNEGVGFSVLPLLILLKLFNKKQINFFVMGLFSKRIKFPSLFFIHKLLIKLLISCVDNVFFLGEGEFNRAKRFINRNKKFHFTGFCIDTNFWKIDQSVDKKNNQILFVGNDGNRNISLLLNLIDKMKSYDFLVISNLLEQQINKKNLRIINGNWNSKDISDYDLKKHYKESLITIIPLNNSYQPSGQSVALQSMSQGTPVFISKTKGFWEPDSFKNNEHLIFLESEDTEEWEKKINETVNDQKLMNFISESSVKKINDEYNLSVYYSKIKKIIDI